MKHVGLAATLAVALLVTAPTTAQAQAPAPAPVVRDPTAHRHLGFLVRPYLGFGYLSGTIPATGGDLTLSGLSAQLGVVVGGAVAENFILGGELYATAISEPNVSQGAFSGTANDTSFGNVGIGPNLTYYFMPVNMYLSLTPALTRLTIRIRGTDGNSNWGFGGRAAVGKEWWVSDHWGLGVAGQFTYSTNSGDGTSSNASAWGAGAVFSATYN